MPRRYRPVTPRLDEPPWLTKLRVALFSDPRLPVQDDAFAYDGARHLCRRTLEDDGLRVLFREVVLDPMTHQVRHQWSVEIEAGAFAGVIPPGILAQQVQILATWLVASRPARTPVDRPRPFRPGRFAHRVPVTRR